MHLTAPADTLSRLVAHILKADEDETPLICLEDMAVATVAAPLVADDARPAAESWQAAVARWQASSPSSFRPLRLQPLFLRTLEILRANQVDTLSRWDVAVLLKALELAAPLAAGPGALFREALLPYENDLRALAQHHGALFDLRAAVLDISYVSAKDIAACRAREVKSVAGIDIGFMGPLMSHSGSVKVLDSVPDSCALVVDGGACFVNGYVFGRVIASEACHVGRTISGKVVVRQGNISAEGAFRRAFLVTKNGDVDLRTTEDPELIYAGSSISIADRAFLGTYAAPRITVRGDAVGGAYAVSDRLDAGTFRCGGDRGLAIYLQRAMMPEDYGEVLSRDARKLTIQWVKLRQQLTALERTIAMNEDEIERTAASAISYLLGGEEVRKEVEEIRQSERRLHFLDRLIAGLDALSESVEARAGAGAEAGSDTDAGWEEVTEPWVSGDDEDVDPAWVNEEQELTKLGESLQKQRVDVRTRETLFGWSEKSLEWVRERNTLQGVVERKRSDLKRLMGRAETVNNLDIHLTKQRQLAVLLESLRDRNAKADWAERAAKPFMRLLLRNIASLRGRSNHYAQSIPSLRDQLTKLSEQLRSEFSVRLDVNDARRQPTVHGCFEEGVCIYARRMRDVAGAGDVSVTTPDSGDTVRQYVREGNRIVEQGG